MEDKKLNRFKAALIINLVCVVFGIYSCTLSYFFNDNGWSCLSFYTVLSNIFGTITALIWVCYGFYNLGKGNCSVPKKIQILHFISTCCLLLTFFVVLFLLLPTDFAQRGSIAIYHKFFSSLNFWHHLTLPICSILSIIFFEKEPVLPFKVTLFSLIPTGAYALICITLNILKILDGPYFFVRVYNQPWYMSIFWCFVVLGINFGLSCGLYALNKIGKNKEN